MNGVPIIIDHLPMVLLHQRLLAMNVMFCDTVTGFAALMTAVDLVSFGEMEKQSATITTAKAVPTPMTFI